MSHQQAFMISDMLFVETHQDSDCIVQMLRSEQSLDLVKV